MNEILEYSEKYNMQHLPSAMSMHNYVSKLFSEKIINPYRDNIIIGKPFGAQSYYVTWIKEKYINDKQYSYGVSHDEIDFVNFSDVTLGNSLGVASGIELSNKKLTWCNLSDSQLQMGAILEAIQFIGRNKQNIKLTIDFNNFQLTGSLMTSLSSCENLFSSNNWKTYILKEYSVNDLDSIFKEDGPIVIFFLTEKVIL